MTNFAMANQGLQGWPRFGTGPSNFNQQEGSHENQSNQKETLPNYQASQRRDLGYGQPAPIHKLKEKHITNETPRPIGRPIQGFTQRQQTTGLPASETQTPTARAHAHGYAKSLSFATPGASILGPPAISSVTMRRRQSIEERYNDLLERLNAVEIEVPGHTDKFRNKAPMPIWSAEHGEFDSDSLVTPVTTRTVQPPPGFQTFGPRAIDANTCSPWETNYTAAYPSPESDTDQDLIQTPQTPWSQPTYPAAPLNFAQQHFRNRSSMNSIGTLPPNCATAATFSPSSIFPSPLKNPSYSTAPPLDFHPQPTTAPFKPSLMVQELNGQYHPDDLFLGPNLDPYSSSTHNLIHPGINATSGCSRNYKGNHFLPSNRSADIPDKDNCSFFITGLPPTISTHTLLAHIRDAGRVYASYINEANPSAGHLTAAAKLVFFEKISAQVFWARHKEQLPLMVGGYAAKAVRNRIKVAEPTWQKNFTRVVVISGPDGLIGTERLLKVFEENFVFHIDEIIEDPSDVPELDREEGWVLPKGWRTVEIRFGSWRSQAQTCCQVLDKHPDFRGVRFRYGRDPCDRVECGDRHLYRVGDGENVYGYGEGMGMRGFGEDAEQSMFPGSPQTSDSSPGGGAPLGLDFCPVGSLGPRLMNMSTGRADVFGDVPNASVGRLSFATTPSSDSSNEDEDSGVGN